MTIGEGEFGPAGADPFKNYKRPDVVLPAAAFNGKRKIADIQPEEVLKYQGIESRIHDNGDPAGKMFDDMTAQDWEKLNLPPSLPPSQENAWNDDLTRHGNAAALVSVDENGELQIKHVPNADLMEDHSALALRYAYEALKNPEPPMRGGWFKRLLRCLRGR